MLFAMLLSSVTWQFLARLSQSLNSCAFCSLRIPTRILTEFISKSEILTGLTHPFDLLLLQERVSRSLASTKYQEARLRGKLLALGQRCRRRRWRVCACRSRSRELFAPLCRNPFQLSRRTAVATSFGFPKQLPCIMAT